MRVFDKRAPQRGGSTLATQIEKFRHWPDGRTAAPAEKQRASSRFLRPGNPELERNQQLPALAGANGIIAPALRDTALEVPLALNRRPRRREAVSL